MSTDAQQRESKGDVFLDRYIKLAHALHQHAEPTDALTVSAVAELWDCSVRSAQDSLQRLKSWGLIRWIPQAGRGKRSRLILLVHPVHVYFEKAQRALAKDAWAEAGFWLGEIMRECPCIPMASELLSEVRQNLGLTELAACCEGQIQLS